MAERWLGVVASSSELVVVDIEWSAPPVIQSDQTWRLQDGSRPAAYRVFFKRCSDYVSENGIVGVVIKGSAVTQGSATLALLHSAEVRGVAMAAFASAGARVETTAKATLSKTFGDRKVDEYLSDDAFWKDLRFPSGPRKGSRMAALLVVSHLKV